VSLAEETGAERLLDLVGARVPAAQADAARGFARAYTRRLSGDASVGIASESLAAEIAGAFALASGRGDEPVVVRVVDPVRDADGYEPLGTVVETSSDDWPFLVDSVSAELQQSGLAVTRMLHPIVGVERGPDGAITAITPPRDAERRESVMHFDLARRLDEDERARVETAVREVLLTVRGVVADFPAMVERVDDMVTVARGGTARYPRDEVHEVSDFLEWLLDGNFILLGAREYDFSSGAIRLVESAPETWSMTRSLTPDRRRTELTATLLQDGTVLVAVSLRFGPFMRELYDTQSGTCTATADPNTVRVEHTATLLGKR
jgi:glutamate dehydrogenase